MVQLTRIDDTREESQDEPLDLLPTFAILDGSLSSKQYFISLNAKRYVRLSWLT